MAWAKVDDGFWSHPKVMGLSLDACGLWTLALSWSCHQRRDVVPSRFLGMVGADDATAKELVAAGLWDECDGGWVIHDWRDYQDASLSEKRAEAGSKGGKRSGQSRRSNTKQTDEANGKQTKQTDEANSEAGPALPGPSLPNPKTKPLPSTDVDREPAEIDAVDADDAAASFETFWDRYPKRNGKKLGKANALIEWRKLKPDERDRAMAGASNLARSDTLPKDPERFLRRSKGGRGGFPFDDWQEPDDGGHLPPEQRPCPECGGLLGWLGHPECGVRVDHG